MQHHRRCRPANAQPASRGAVQAENSSAAHTLSYNGPVWRLHTSSSFKSKADDKGLEKAPLLQHVQIEGLLGFHAETVDGTNPAWLPSNFYSILGEPAWTRLANVCRRATYYCVSTPSQSMSRVLVSKQSSSQCFALPCVPFTLLLRTQKSTLKPKTLVRANGQRLTTNTFNPILQTPLQSDPSSSHH